MGFFFTFMVKTANWAFIPWAGKFNLPFFVIRYMLLSCFLGAFFSIFAAQMDCPRIFLLNVLKNTLVFQATSSDHLYYHCHTVCSRLFYCYKTFQGIDNGEQVEFMFRLWCLANLNHKLTSNIHGSVAGVWSGSPVLVKMWKLFEDEWC